MTRVIASTAWLGAAALAVVGSTATFVTQLDDGRPFYRMTTWVQEQPQLAIQPFPSPPLGIVLVVGAALLVTAAGLSFRPARAQLARLLGTYGTAAMSAATMGLIVMFNAFGRSEGLPPSITNETGLAPWLLIGGSVLAIGGLVLALGPKKGQ